MGCGIKRILQFNDIVELGPIQVYDSNNNDITNKCKYSWSNDMVCWTGWTDYNTYLDASQYVEEAMYLRVLLFDSFSKISINECFTTCYQIYLDQSNPFLESFCDNENLYNPYTNLDCALQLQQQLADSIICMFGIPIYYFRTLPDKDSSDYTFKEYVLHNVVDVKRIKLMIQDGQMPSSNPKFTALDFDWELDWEVEVGKTDFATAFGDTAFPNTQDFIYIPMMNRMYKVNSAYDEKNGGLMWRSTTWKLSLVKYEDNTAISSSEEIESIIDKWIENNYEDTFGRKEKMEQERVSGTTQIDSPRIAATNLTDISMEDSIRHKYSKDEVTVVDYQCNHKSIVVSRTMYRVKKPTSTITYQKGYCGHDGTLSFILQTQGEPIDSQNLLNMGPIQVQLKWVDKKDSPTNEPCYKIIFNDQECYIKSFATQLIVIRWNQKTYSASLNVYEYVHRENVPAYLLRPEMYWFSEEPVSSISTPYNNDFNTTCSEECYIQPYPHMITNIKLYNKDLGPNESITESLKYVTQHPACVFNDLARHFTSGHGYFVR